MGGHRRWNFWAGLIVLYAFTTAVVAILVFVVLVVVALAVEMWAQRIRDHGVLLSVTTAACLVAAVVGWVANAKKGEREELFRLQRFAAANGFDFAPEVKEPDLPGLIFQRGTLRRSSARLRRFGPRPLEVANYSAWIEKGRAGEPLTWSYFALTLDRRMPHVVLDARANGRLPGTSSLPGTRETSLGDGYRLICAPEAADWAHSLFTPEIVARFTRPGKKTAVDVEVVADRVFVYSRFRPLSGCDPETWRWMCETADALYDRIEDLLGS